mgnify:CR=1 FL=1
MMLPQTALLTFLFATTTSMAGLAAQSTWVVDASRGAGYTHVDIGAAIASASHGDFIEVRAGTYASPGSIRKGVRIVGRPGATIDIGNIGFPFSIQGVPAGQVCVIRGFMIKGLYTSSGFAYISDNPGVVALQDLKTSTALILTAGISVLRCPAVYLDRCQIVGGLRIESSTVTITGGRFDDNRAAAAILAKKTSLTLSGIQATGLMFSTQGLPALEVQASAVILSKAVGARLAASSGSSGIPAILGDSASTLVYDPGVQLVPNSGTQAIQGFASITSRRLPTLDLRGGALGQSLSLDLRSPQGDFYALFVGLPGKPLALPFGDLWLDLRLVILISAGLQGSTGLSTTVVPIPSRVALRGVTLSWQAQSGSWPHQEYTNACLGVVH